MSLRRLVPALVLPLLMACGTPIDFWATKEFDIDIAAIPPEAADLFVDGGQKENQTVVDLTNQKETMDKLQQIESVVVPEIWLEVSQVDATNRVTLASGKLEASEDADGAERIVLGDFRDLPVAPNGKIDLKLNADSQIRVQNLALEKKKFRIYYSASLNRECTADADCASSAKCNEPVAPATTGRCSRLTDALPAKFHVKASVHVLVTIKL
jgi:hypothetical protein